MGLLDYSVGQKLTATRLNRHNPIAIVKSGDTTITSSVTLTADPHLVLTLLAGIRYHVIGELLVVAVSTTPDFKRQWAWTNTATVTCGGIGSSTAVTSALGDANSTALVADSATPTASLVYGCSTDQQGVIINDTVLVGSSANSTFTLTWAQNVSSADGVTVKANSWITAIPIL